MVYSDTSFLYSVYGDDAHSAVALRVLGSLTEPIVISLFNEYELVNALRLTEFHKLLPAGEAANRISDFEQDLRSGNMMPASCNLARVMEEGRRLSLAYTITRGHRSFDILHVAAALVMGAQNFLTFDANQRKLAESEGLKVPL